MLRILISVTMSASACMLFNTLNYTDNIEFSNSISSSIFFGILAAFFFFSYSRNYDKRILIFSHAAGLFFSLLISLGYFIQHSSVSNTILLFFVSVFVGSHLFALILCTLWTVLDHRDVFTLPSARFTGKMLDYVFRHRIIVIILLMLCWLPAFLGIYPGNFVYDATLEFQQASEGYNNAFPMLHSILVTSALNLSYVLTDSYNVGVAAVTLFQMLVLAMIQAYILNKLYEFHASPLVLSAAFLYVALLPTIHLLVTCTVRDILFSGMLTLLVMFVYEMTCSNTRTVFFASLGKPIAFGITAATTMLLRSNGGIAMFFLLALMCFAIIIYSWLKMKRVLSALVLTCVAIICYAGLNAGLTLILRPTPATLKSSLSVFAHQIVRAYNSGNNEFTEEEKALFNRFWPDGVEYLPTSADLSKYYLHLGESSQDRAEFLKFWSTIGKRNLIPYLEALLTKTQQLWFPDVVINGYHPYAYTEFDKSYFYYGPKIEFPAVLTPISQTLNHFYKRIALDLSFEKIPIISMFFSIGALFWMLLHAIFYVLYRRRYNSLAPLLLLLAYAIITGVTVPLVLVRYFAALFFSVPVTLFINLQPNELDIHTVTIN